MIKYFTQVEFHGIVFRDPATMLSNLLLFIAGLWCFFRVTKLQGKSADAGGWSLFFLFGAIAAFIGIAVHGLSWYIPVNIHFRIWIVMGWMQNVSVLFAQLGTARRYFTKHLPVIRIVVVVQLLFFCGLMMYIRKFGAVNADVALGLLPIAGWNFYLYVKKQIPSVLIGAGIVFAALPALAVILKLMLTMWISYNDIAHVLLIFSLLMICRGVEKCAG